MSESSPPESSRPESPRSTPTWRNRLKTARRIDWGEQYQQARARADSAEPARPVRRRSRVDVTTTGGAFVVIMAAAAVLWVIQVINVIDHYGLDRAGLRPRTAHGLWGVLAAPFLHNSWGNLLSDTVAVVIIGGAVLLGGVIPWIVASVAIILVGGLLTWLIAPAGLIVGSSWLIFGWLGYLITRAYFSRRLKWIFSAIVVLVFFGGLLSGLVPTLGSHVSWQSHLCGFAAGLGIGALLHQRRRGARKAPRHPVGSAPGPDNSISAG